jgi:C-terminal processing protease CtpA/Prc
MKRFFLVLALFGLLAACAKDKTETPDSKPTNPDHLSDIDVPATYNEWIEKYLCEWYLWHEDIEGKTRNHKLPYDKFFYSLLSTNRNDGRDYSDGHQFFSQVYQDPISGGRSVAGVRSPGNTLSPASSDFANSFGFDVQPVQLFTSNDTDNTTPGQNYYSGIYFAVLYVVPGGQAEKAGLKRGDHISRINGTLVTESNYRSLYDYIAPGVATTVRLKGYRMSVNPGPTVGGANPGYYMFDRTPISEVNLSPLPVSDTPILEDEVITSADYTGLGSKKVGYLAYQRFTTGTVDFEDATYNNELKRIFSGWKSQGVTEAVIDLRYNGGGAVMSSWMMACMLANKVGTTFSREVRNAYVTREYFGGKDDVLPFVSVDYFQGSSGDKLKYFGPDAGANLGLSKVYVLAAEGTASASELLMSGLRGANVDVIHIGATTVGKNVGMDLVQYGQNDDVTYSGNFGAYTYYMWPISFQSFNAKDTTTPKSGWDPENSSHGKGKKIEELAYPELMYDLGDPDEPLLKAALRHIATGSFPASVRSASRPAATYQRMDLKHPPRNTDMYNAPRRIDLKKN